MVIKRRLKFIVVVMMCAFSVFFVMACGSEKEDSTEQERTVTIPTEGELMEKTTAEDLSTEITTENVQEQEPVQHTDEQLTTLLNQAMEERTFTGDCSIAVVDLISKNMAVVDNHSMQAASLIKLYIAGAVYENIENDVIENTANMDGLLSKMIIESDNTAANDLVKLLGDQDVVLGMEKVNQYCITHGFSDTHMGRLLLAPNDDDDNYTSVKDVTAFLVQIYEGKLAGSIDILSYMKSQQRKGKLPAGIPEGVVTANKTGELPEVENDAMVVLTEEKPYVICVMGQYLSSTGEARTWMTNLSSTVFEYNQQSQVQLFDAG